MQLHPCFRRLCLYRYGVNGWSDYKRNIQRLFHAFRRVLSPDTLVVWTTALPVSQSVRGGVILEEIRFLSDVLRYDVLRANNYTSMVAADYGFDVVDLHYSMRRHISWRLGKSSINA